MHAASNNAAEHLIQNFDFNFVENLKPANHTKMGAHPLRQVIGGI